MFLQNILDLCSNNTNEELAQTALDILSTLSQSNIASVDKVIFFICLFIQLFQNI